MFLPFCAACVWVLLSGELEFDYFDWPAFAVWSDEIFDNESCWFKIVSNDPVNEIAMIGFLTSLCFIALSKEKDEDEMTGMIRMQSFVWSLWVTASLLAFCILFVYGVAFMTLSFVALFMIFLVYIIKFNLSMRAARRAGR